MKPLRLSFSGIGSYPDDVDIDFNDLHLKGIYLIVGPTGAGKTTLFDAMTYALYGKVASDRSTDIVSAYSHRHPPKIEFTFEHGNRTYVAHRELALPTKTPIPSQQWLREISLNGKELNTVTGSKQVSEKCRELLGLNAEEFNQVILLPQGKFQRFLMATGSDKQKILQTIFGTLHFRAVVDELRATVDRHWLEVSNDQKIVGQQWATIDSGIASLNRNKMISDIPDPHDSLDVTIAFLTRRLDELKRLESDANNSVNLIRRLHTKAAHDAERFDKSKQLQALRVHQAGLVEKVGMAKKRLATHDAAVPVTDSADAKNDFEIKLKIAAGEVRVTREKIKQIAASIRVTPSVKAQFTASIAKDSPSDLARELSILNQVLAEGRAAYSELSSLSSKIKSNDKERLRLSHKLKILAKQQADTKRFVARAGRALVDDRTQLKDLRSASTEVSRLDQLLDKSNVSEAERLLKLRQSVLNSKLRAFERAEIRLQSANELLRKESAGQLAARLKDHEACPVCGSTVHPKKAKLSSTSVNVTASKSTRDKAFEQFTNASRDVKDAEKVLNDAKECAARLPSQSVQKSIRNKFERLTKLESAMDDREYALNEAKDKLQDITELISEAKQAEAVCINEGTAMATRQRFLQGRVSGIGKLEHVTNALKASKPLGEKVATLEKIVARHQSLIGEAKLASATFLSALRGSPFSSENEARAALLRDKERADFAQSVERFSANEIEILKLTAAIGNESVPKSRPNIEELSKQLDAAEAVFKDTSTAVAEITLASRQIADAHTQIHAIQTAMGDKISNANKAEAIATVFERGAGGPDGQLSLEMWIQRTSFEEVCLVANSQLRELSANRYSLTLEQVEGGLSKSRGSGLDIYVLDSYTGKTRPVQSMSGGEQFIASLALALALAEVVQRHAGGIELPCLFIDEGFGSLDHESLDRAIDVLGKLHAAGRTVGIITHVEAMQQQLPIGIRVNKTDQGSHIEVFQN